MADIITIVGKDSVAPGPKTSATNHTAWLEQLESAQWQQRLRYQPEPGGQRQSGEQPSAQQQAARQPGSARGAVEPGRDAHAAGQAAAPDAGRSDVKQMAASAAQGSAAAKAPAAFGPGAPVLQPMPTGATVREVQAWPQLRRMAATQWQAQHAHVMAGEQGVRMWLRDARYEKGDGRRLLLEMRARLARMGMRLAEFTLNGEQVAVPGQTNQASQSDQK